MGEESGMSSRIVILLTILAVFTVVAMEVVIILMLSGTIGTAVSVKEENSCPGGTEPTDAPPVTGTTVAKTFYGITSDGNDIHKFTFTNVQNSKLEVITFGAIITSLTVADKNGLMADVVLGYTNIADYEVNEPHMGSLVGRVANRIANGTFSVDGVTYHLARNDGDNTIHGGVIGYDKRVWTYEQHADHVSMSLFSPDGEEGFPGDVEVTVDYWLTDANEVVINYTARAYKKATPINLTSHPYFNLAGEGQDKASLEDHEVQIEAGRYLEDYSDLIPTGRVLPVSGDLDLRNITRLGDVMHRVTFDGVKDGYDHSYVLYNPAGIRFAARARHPGSGRVMEVYTDQPSLQFYTSNFLNTTGKHPYSPQTAFCMETQNYSDAVNHDNFPESVLRPGSSTYRQICVYKFYAV